MALRNVMQSLPPPPQANFSAVGYSSDFTSSTQLWSSQSLLIESVNASRLSTRDFLDSAQVGGGGGDKRVKAGDRKSVV